MVATALQHLGGFNSIHDLAAARTLGTAPEPQHTQQLLGLDGSPDLVKLAAYAPIQKAHMVRVPTLVIDAADEELWDRSEFGGKLHNILQQAAVTTEYVLTPGLHYDAYGPNMSSNSALAADWFVNHLVSAVARSKL